MSESIWALIGVVFGGLVGGGSQLLTSHLQWKREEKATRRKQRTTNLYELQDHMLAVNNFVFERIRVKNDPFDYVTAVFDDEKKREELKGMIRRVENVSVRVGDDPLSRRLDDALRSLTLAMEEGTTHERNDQLRTAREAMKEAQYRVGRLLHTDIEVDLGVPAKLSQRETAG